MTNGSGDASFSVSLPSVPVGNTITATATDAAKNTSESSACRIVCGDLTLTPAGLANGKLGVAYNQTIAGNGGTAPYTFTLTSGALPDGLTLSSSGVVSGTPTRLQSLTFTVTAADSFGCTVSRSYTVMIDLRWAPVGSLNTARSSHSATLLQNGKVLVAGGFVGSSAQTSAELYDPATGLWTNTASLAIARGSHTATLLTNGKVLVAGGSNSLNLSSSVLYDPASNTWSNTGNLNTARSGHTATLLGNGKVLIVGGTGSLSSAELYDPASGTWSNTGSLTTGRNEHSATLLANGKVLVAGGINVSTVLNSAELYDSTAGTWSNTGPLNIARRYHTATLLADGKVLTAGGQDGDSFLYTVERRDKTVYFPALLDGEAENFFGAVITATSVNQPITIKSPAPHAGSTVVLEVSLQGVTTVPHRVAVSVNDSFAGNAADFVIIAPASLTGVIKPLADLRAKQGLITTLVDIEDIYDEFSFGNKSSQAIKDFLSFAATSWKLQPRFVLFAGDASYDPRNYLGLGAGDLVPTKSMDTRFMETASDDWFADFDGDGVADIGVGRLPVRSAQEASVVINKLLAYESAAPRAEIALVADRNDGFDFEQGSANLRGLVPSDIHVTEILRARTDDAKARRQLLDAINRGQKIVNYTGHGSGSVWRGNLLTAADGPLLTNRDRLSIFIVMTCLNGYFQDAAADSLAEALIKSEGGAVAAWASSGLTLPADQAEMNRELYRLIFQQGAKAITLGDAARLAKSAIKDKDVRLTWILLGDPTMNLR